MAVRVAGYTKLAKLWERDRDRAIALQNDYYESKFRDDPDFSLVGVYVDITGNKEIYKRTEMLRLIRDCQRGKVDVICSQTKGYLAANTRDFCYLIKLLFEMPHHIEIVTEDSSYNINTGYDAEGQRRELYTMADKYAGLNRKDYDEWLGRVSSAMGDD